MLESILKTRRFRVAANSIEPPVKTSKAQDNGKEKFTVLLGRVIDETLREVFKQEGVKAIYGFLERNLNLPIEEILEDPEAFSSGLETLLGSGAQLIEKLILKNLCSNLRLEFREGNGFLDHVTELREKCG